MPTNFLSEVTGLSASKLGQATATEGDVLVGKTFYSGDKSLKTGTNTNSDYLELTAIMTFDTSNYSAALGAFSINVYTGSNNVNSTAAGYNIIYTVGRRTVGCLTVSYDGGSQRWIITTNSNCECVYGPLKGSYTSGQQIWSNVFTASLSTCLFVKRN